MLEILILNPNDMAALPKKGYVDPKRIIAITPSNMQVGSTAAGPLFKQVTGVFVEGLGNIPVHDDLLDLLRRYKTALENSKKAEKNNGDAVLVD